MALKDQVATARQLTQDLQEFGSFDITRGCLQFAWAVQRVTGARIAAGSASWLYLGKDDEHSTTHVSYEFELFMQEVAEGKVEFDFGGNVLPEMHVWNIHQGRVLDISIQYFKTLATRLGYTWTAAPLPDFYHGKAERMKHGRVVCSYRENRHATALATRLADRITSMYEAR